MSTAEEDRIEKLERGIKKALSELGVPQPGYPAPVTNAVKYLEESLNELGAKNTGV